MHDEQDVVKNMMNQMVGVIDARDPHLYPEKSRFEPEESAEMDWQLDEFEANLNERHPQIAHLFTMERFKLFIAPRRKNVVPNILKRRGKNGYNKKYERGEDERWKVDVEKEKEYSVRLEKRRRELEETELAERLNKNQSFPIETSHHDHSYFHHNDIHHADTHHNNFYHDTPMEPEHFSNFDFSSGTNCKENIEGYTGTSDNPLDLGLGDYLKTCNNPIPQEPMKSYNYNYHQDHQKYTGTSDNPIDLGLEDYIQPRNSAPKDPTLLDLYNNNYHDEYTGTSEDLIDLGLEEYIQPAPRNSIPQAPMKSHNYNYHQNYTKTTSEDPIDLGLEDYIQPAPRNSIPQEPIESYNYNYQQQGTRSQMWAPSLARVDQNPRAKDSRKEASAPQIKAPVLEKPKRKRVRATKTSGAKSEVKMNNNEHNILARLLPSIDKVEQSLQEAKRKKREY